MLELAIGIILAGCGIGAGLALIAGIGPDTAKATPWPRPAKPSAASPRAKAT